MQGTLASRPAHAHPHRVPLKIYFCAVVIIGVLSYLAFSAFSDNTVYYFTLQEFSAQHATVGSQTVRVNGPLDQSSIQLDQKNMVLRFNLKDGNTLLPVEYRGVVPDTLKTGESVVAEGHLGPNGVFLADQILVKCPS